MGKHFGDSRLNPRTPCYAGSPAVFPAVSQPVIGQHSGWCEQYPNYPKCLCEYHYPSRMVKDGYVKGRFRSMGKGD